MKRATLNEVIATLQDHPDQAVVSATETDDDDEGEEVFAVTNPAAVQRPRNSVSAEAFGQWNQKVDFTPPVHPKTAEQKISLRAVLLNSFMFNNLDENDLNTVIDAMEQNGSPQEPVLAGTQLIDEGDNGNFMYVVESGELECVKKGMGVVKICIASDIFGELALLYNVPRAASVSARTNCVLWRLDRETFVHIVRDAATTKRLRREEFLKNVEVLKPLDSYELAQLTDALRDETYSCGQDVIVQGTEGNVFYIIEEGAAQALKDGEVVMSYQSGDYFGELALLWDAPRAATVRISSQKAKVLALNRKTFTRMVGSLGALLKTRTQQYS